MGETSYLARQKRLRPGPDVLGAFLVYKAHAQGQAREGGRGGSKQNTHLTFTYEPPNLDLITRNKSRLWRGLRYHKTTQRVTVRHYPAVPSLRHHKNLFQVVLALALAGGEAAREAGAGAARLLRSTHIVLGHQSLQLLQRKRPKEL